jgi:hypothetical protein
MAEGRSPLRSLLPVVLLVTSALGIYNVFADNSEVRQMAQKLAASPSDTQPKLMREEKGPIGQSFDYQSEGRGLVTVGCARGLFLVGSYTCSVRGGAAAPAPSVSAR